MAAKKGVDMDTDHIWNCDLLHRVQNSSSPDLMNKNVTLTKLAELAKTEPENFVKLTALTNTSEQLRLKIYENNCSGNQDEFLGYSIGGFGRRSGSYYQTEIMGLKKTNGRLEWVSAGSMTEGRYSMSAIKAPRSLTPFC